MDYRDATCAGTNDPLFFPPEDQEDTAAEIAGYRYCYSCPVYVSCLDDAIQSRELGVWAATSLSTRNSIRRERDRKKCPRCRGSFLSVDGTSASCLSCGLSWNTKTPSHEG